MEFWQSMKDFYYDINSATLSGAIDAVVVRHPDGSLHGSPFHVRFGKLNVLRTRERVVSIKVNGQPVPLQMKLGAAGECFFVNKRPDVESEQLAGDILTSPIPSPRTRSRSSSPHGIGFPPRRRLPEDVSLEEFQAESPSRDANLRGARERQGDTAVPTPSPSNGTTPVPRDTTPIAVPAVSPPPTASDGDISRDSSNFLDEERRGLQEDAQARAEAQDGAIVEWDWGALPVPDHLPLAATSRRKSSNDGQQKQQVQQHRMSWITELGRSLHRDSPRHDQYGRQHHHHYGRQHRDQYSPSPMEGVYLRDLDPQLREIEPDNISFHSTNEEFFLDHLSSEGSPPFAHRASGHTPGSRTPAGTLPGSPDLGSDAESPQPPWMHSDVPFPGAAGPQVLPINGMGEGIGQLLSNPPPHAVGDGRGHMMSQSVPLLGPVDEPPHLSSHLRRSHAVDHLARSLPDHNAIDLSGVYDGPAVTRRSEIEISLCGGLSQDADIADLEREFDKHAVSFDEFESNPMLLSHPNLVVRIHGKYLNWASAAPVIMSFVLFHRPLNPVAVDKILEENIPKTAKRGWRWFGGWSRSKTTSESESVDTVPTMDLRQPSVSSESGSAGAGESPPSPRRDFFKALRLSSDQLKQLNLKDGDNTMEFSVVSKIQGRATVKCHVYLWPHDAKIVISDIDGTITKSDVLGHAAAMFGKDWTHVGVASLYSHLAANGYHLLYLSSRSISHAPLTRGYINGVKQNDFTLPGGPILLSPTSLMRSFHNEVILKVSDRFKTACLRDVLHLFPEGSSYYAGFGNRSTDINAYKQVGIREPRIFIINPHGQIQVPTSTFRSSYNKLDQMVDVLFPPVDTRSPQDTTYSSFEYWQSAVPSVTDEELAAFEAQL